MRIIAGNGELLTTVTAGDGDELITLPPGTPPPDRADLWWTDPWTWARCGGEWQPLPRGVVRLRPGQGPMLVAADDPGTGGLRGRTIAAGPDLAIGGLVACAARGRGRWQPVADAEQALAELEAGRVAAAVVGPRATADGTPSSWWTLDLAAWWEAEALAPLVAGLLFKRRSLGDDPGELPGAPAGPAEREGIRQLLITAAELGLAPADRDRAFMPANFGRAD